MGVLGSGRVVTRQKRVTTVCFGPGTGGGRAGARLEQDALAGSAWGSSQQSVQGSPDGSEWLRRRRRRLNATACCGISDMEGGETPILGPGGARFALAGRRLTLLHEKKCHLTRNSARPAPRRVLRWARGFRCCDAAAGPRAQPIVLAPGCPARPCGSLGCCPMRQSRRHSLFHASQHAHGGGGEAGHLAAGLAAGNAVAASLCGARCW